MKIIADRVVFVTEDSHHNGGFPLNCTSATNISSPQGVCGWDEGSTAALSLNAAGTEVTAQLTFGSDPPTYSTRNLIRPTTAMPAWVQPSITTMAPTPIPSSCP